MALSKTQSASKAGGGGRVSAVSRAFPVWLGSVAYPPAVLGLRQACLLVVHKPLRRDFFTLDKSQGLVLSGCPLVTLFFLSVLGISFYRFDDNGKTKIVGTVQDNKVRMDEGVPKNLRHQRRRRRRRKVFWSARERWTDREKEKERDRKKADEKDMRAVHMERCRLFCPIRSHFRHAEWR